MTIILTGQYESTLLDSRKTNHGPRNLHLFKCAYILVRVENFEISTYRLKAGYSASELHPHGGDGRNRAFDLLRMKQLFYRLNYITIIENTAMSV